MVVVGVKFLEGREWWDVADVVLYVAVFSLNKL